MIKVYVYLVYVSCLYICLRIFWNRINLENVGFKVTFVRIDFLEEFRFFISVSGGF